MKNHQINVLAEDIAQLIDKAYGYKAVRDGDMDALYKVITHYGRRRKYYIAGRLPAEDLIDGNSGDFFNAHTLPEAVGAFRESLLDGCYDEDRERLRNGGLYLETVIEQPEWGGPIMHINCGMPATEEGEAAIL